MGVYSGVEPTWASQTNVGRTHIATKGIVQSGLVLNLDAGVLSSYSGIGTSWTDLSGGNNTGTLINGPTFNSSNGGSIVFDGVDDQSNLSISPLTDVQMEGALTYDYWVRPTGTIKSGFVESNSGTSYYSPGTPTFQGLSGDTNYKYVTAGIYAGFGFAFGTNGFMAGIHKNGYAPPILVDYRTYNGIFHLVVIKNLTNCLYYINGVLIKTSLTASSGVTILGDTMKRITSPQDSFNTYFKGNIYSVRFYNRALTPQEIQQNFNATRSRFGI